MKSGELKKCEAKLNELYKQIKSKESTKVDQEADFVKKKTLMRSLSSQIKSSIDNRQQISRELNDLKNQRDVLHVNMNRIKAELLYKTRGEYEEMIKRFENELEKNRKYCPSEERRLLSEIKMHKGGLNQLESYEDLKKSYDKLNEACKEKKQQLDEAWNLDREYHKQWSSTKEDCNNLTKLIADINLELEELNNKKLELKKLVEDLNRENVLKQQIARKNLLEKQNSKKQKEDEVESSMESALREYNKLITYFHKLSNQEDSDAGNTPTAAMGMNMQKMGWLQNSPSVESMSPNSFYLDKQHTLNESADENKPETNDCNSAGEYETDGQKQEEQARASRLEPPRTLKIPTLATVKSEPLLSPTFFNNTPDEPAGLFIMKKKFDDDRWNNNAYRKRHNKKSKNNKVKISHSVEVINLLSKLNIPIHLSSQVDECLKVLYTNRDDLQNQLNLYKQNRRATLEKHIQSKEQVASKTLPSKVPDEFQMSTSASSTLGEECENAKSSKSCQASPNYGKLQLLDNQSDISSNMDSNYESDNNSINLNLPETLPTTTPSVLPSFTINSDSHHVDEVKHTLIKQKTQTSSDESDATLTECPPGIELLYKKGKSSNSNSSSSNSDNTITPASPKTPTPTNPFNECCTKLNLDKLTLVEQESPVDASNTTATTTLDPKRKISRQISDISDGYSSSATPLSASSINNEQPTINPFFPSSNK